MKKKKKPKYNQTSAIVSSLKRAFSRSPTVSEFLKEHRQEHPQYNKDGSLAKKPAVRFPCVVCKEIHMGKNIQVDHIDPVVPLNIPAKHVCMDELIKRLFCDKSNLQILCKPCHKIKSKEENAKRNEWKSEDKEKHFVYKTTNSVNGKFYIGVHSTFNYDDEYIGSGKALKAAIDKYGKEKFYRKILFVYETREEALAKEAELVNESFIKSEDNYNLIIGGLGGIAFASKNITQETKDKIGRAHKGRVYSEETKAKISNTLKGRSRPEEVKAKLRESNKNKNTKKILCSNGKVYNSMREASEELGVLPQSISRICRGLKKTTKGLSFSYLEAMQDDLDV